MVSKRLNSQWLGRGDRKAGLPTPARSLREKRQEERVGRQAGEGPVKKSDEAEQKEEGQHEVGPEGESPREFVPLMGTYTEQNKPGHFKLQETWGVWLGKQPDSVEY